MVRLVLAAPFLSSGCSPPDKTDTLGDKDPCATSDGACDEPSGCAYGSDPDCDDACTSDVPPDDPLAGACAHRAAAVVEAPQVDPVRGSGGTGGPIGAWDGIATVRGEREAQEVERPFRVYVPERYDPAAPTPVLFVLGGFTVDMYGLQDYTEIVRTADLNGFIVVFGDPEYRYFGADYGWVYSWYIYREEFDGDGWEDNPDVAYLRAVSDEVRALYNVDRSRTFSSGHSRGAALSLVVAFEAPDDFAGFLSESGFMPGYGSSSSAQYEDRMRELAPSLPHRPAGYLFHGSRDPDVRVAASDSTVEVLEELGWVEDEDYHYERIEKLKHEWQPQLNQEAWDFLWERPMPWDEEGR